MPRPTFRPTTVTQRQLLFRTYQTTKSVTEACRQAHVGRGTYYAWRERYAATGEAGLVEPRSRAPHHPARRTSPALEAEVLALHAVQPTWGKRRLAGRLAQQHGGHTVLSPNTVQRIVKAANPPAPARVEPPQRVVPVRHAEEPGQTVNVDLAFVPLTRTLADPIPAVSGSSGQLRVTRTPSAPVPSAGQVFGDDTLDYAEAMRRFAAAQVGPRPPTPELGVGLAPDAQAQRAAVRHADSELRAHRRKVRTQRQAEDVAHRAAQATPRQAEATAQHRAHPAHRRAQLQQRRREDAAWRTERLALRTQWAATRLVTTWVAVLILVDNCTRQSYGLPLFAAGQHITAAVVAAALRALLPTGTAFVITDRGTHFTAQDFTALAEELMFLHVLAPKHRPQTNGVAERFVRTFKTWLRDKTWQTLPELETLAAQFQAEYNRTPHQGLPFPYLSPAEFANYLWLL